MFRKLARVVLAASLLAGGAAAHAQTTVLLRIVYLEPFGCPVGGCGPSLFSFDPAERTVLAKDPVPGGTGSYVTPDGALMVWLDAGFGPAALVLRDMVNGTTTMVPVSSSAAAMIGNPTRPEVYLNDAAGAVARDRDLDRGCRRERLALESRRDLLTGGEVNDGVTDHAH